MKENLLREIYELPDIDRSSARAYHQNLAYLVDQVNRKMAEREDLEKLIGDNPLSLMHENHRNHAAFMDNLFLLNNLSLLVDVVPWVYRAYRNRGFSLDYFPAHLMVWQEAITENLDLKSAEVLLNVYDWILSHHEDFIVLSKQCQLLPHLAHYPENEEQSYFFQSMLEGSRKSVLDMGQRLVEKPQDLPKFYLSFLQPAMYRIGELWEEGEISVAKEHLASALANILVTNQYIRIMSAAKPSKGKLVVCAAPNEFHVLGAQMVANCLEIEGWDVDFLGADTPVQDLVRHVSEQEPHILALSVAMPFNLVQASEIIEEVKKVLPESRPWIMAGGLAFANNPDLVFRIGADAYAEDCNRAVELAEEWIKD